MHLTGTMTVNKDGRLEIGGITATKLVNDYGTPLLVYDEELILEKIAAFQAALAEYPGESQLIYASKAFLCRGLAAMLRKEGLALDIVSEGELARARAGNFPPEKMFFHGNNKSPAEIKKAIEEGVGRFIVDNACEARLLADISEQYEQEVACQLRVTPGIDANTHDYIKTGQKTSKFGVGIATGQAEELALWLEEQEQLNFMGLHSHIGSQIYESSTFKELIWSMAQFMLELRQKHGLKIKEINLGGGIGAPQRAEDSQVNIKNLVTEVGSELAATCKRADYPLPRLLLEPGRAIVGEAGTSLYTIGSVKRVNNSKNYVAVDGGMTDNIRPALYDANYEGFLANRCQADDDFLATVVGKCCESGDVLIKDLELPEPKAGDILTIPASGAYTYSMASNYNGIPRPAVLLVNSGQAEVLIEREKVSELYRLDTLPARFQD